MGLEWETHWVPGGVCGADVELGRYVVGFPPRRHLEVSQVLIFIFSWNSRDLQDSDFFEKKVTKSERFLCKNFYI